MKNELDRLLTFAAALGNPHRLRIVAQLDQGRQYVSALARAIGISRPLLYMHLEKLERAGIVQSKLELSEDGKAMKYYELTSFKLTLDATTIARAVAQSQRKESDDDS